MSNNNEFLFRANDESKNDHRKNIDRVNLHSIVS